MRATHDISTQSLPSIAYTPGPDALFEAEIATLVNVYKFTSNRMHGKRRPPKAASTMRGRIRMLAPTSTVHDQPCLLAAVRELYSRLPETRYLEPWALQRILCTLGYTGDLVEEAEIAAAIEVARTDWTPDEGAA
jgi:hypothetical protein